MEATRAPVLITGIGAELAGASGSEQLWRRLRAGLSAVRSVSGDERFRGIDNAMAALVADHRPINRLPRLDPYRASSYSDEALVAMAAIEQARDDAGLEDGVVDPLRIDIVASSSRGPLAWWFAPGSPFLPGSERPVSRGAALWSLPGTPAALYAGYGTVQGQVTTLSAACVGGHHALGLALDRLRTGAADAVIVAGHEFPVVPALLRSYNALGVLSRRKQDPVSACRPYADDRDGFVLGEGAVALVLERKTDADRRLARGYAELLGQRSENEAGHPTRMDPTGSSAAALMARLLADCRRGVADLSYVCGHASGTVLNDLAECRALRLLCADRPVRAWPPIGGNKAVVGHTLGASGVVNAAAGALMIHHQELVRTVIHGTVDPECALDHVAEGPRSTPVGHVLSLSFALGGQTSALLLGAPA